MEWQILENGEDDMQYKEYSNQDLLARAERFYWDIQPLKDALDKDPSFFLNPEILRDLMLNYCSGETFQAFTIEEKLDDFFQNLFRRIHRTSNEMQLCFDIAPQTDEVCKFLTLCNYLHTRKSIQGMPIVDFVLQESGMNFSDPDSPFYGLPSLVENETEKVKKIRMRILSKREVYIKNIKRNSMSKDSIYEWSFMYKIENEPELADTYKRMHNLYNDICCVHRLPPEKVSAEKVCTAYKKFASKLKKLSYEKVAALQRATIEHICANKDYYGINLYRFERTMRACILSREIERLESCAESKNKGSLLQKFTLLSDVSFPSIYEELYKLPYRKLIRYASVFSNYIASTSVIACLILDELIEQNLFGEQSEWKELFRTTINKLAETVLYNPEKIEFPNGEGAENSFRQILNSSVIWELAPIMPNP
ncbi:MAG: hypothetical protein ACLTWR_08445 [Agathobaculum desmolans]